MSGKKGRVFVFVPDNLKFVPHVFVGKYIDKLVIYPNVSIKDEWNAYKKKQNSPFFNYSKSLISLVEGAFDTQKYASIFKESDFFVFNDGVPFVTYLMLKYSRQNFTLLEEGELTYSAPKIGLRYFVKLLLGYPAPLGFSKHINRIEVRYPQRLPSKTKKKAFVMDLDALMDNLTQVQRKELFSFFNFDVSITIKKPSLLLLSQPLSEDSIINEKEKFELYHKMISPYVLSHTIYVKPHPRELTDYTQWMENCIVLSKDAPSELYHFLDIEFDIALSLFSTAIHAIPAKEHVFLGLDYATKVKENWMRKMDIEKKH